MPKGTGESINICPKDWCRKLNTGFFDHVVVHTAQGIVERDGE